MLYLITISSNVSFIRIVLIFYNNKGLGLGKWLEESLLEKGDLGLSGGRNREGKGSTYDLDLIGQIHPRAMRAKRRPIRTH